ncbi:MAG: HAD family hydrolase [Dethiobacteria bacterium]|jgi:2-haloalkanoic acid dehalogenase type II
MQNISIVSVDMFQTLVDVSSRRHCLWKRILDKEYSAQLAEEYWNWATELIFKNYDDLFRWGKEFISCRGIMEISFRELFSEVGLNLDPETGAQVLVEEHGWSSPYEDTKIFFEKVGKSFPICVVSDADADMIQPLEDLYAFDRVFISEEHQAYKGSPGSSFFKAVVEHYGVQPEEILHIGDSKHDVLGADRVGLQSCWLNRKGLAWPSQEAPPVHTVTVTSLQEAAALLEKKT